MNRHHLRILFIIVDTLLVGSLLPATVGFSPIKQSKRTVRHWSIVYAQDNVGKRWSHADIDWHLEPPSDTPILKRLQMKVAANAIRTELLLRGEACPPVLCPKGGKAVLLAYEKATGACFFCFNRT